MGTVRAVRDAGELARARNSRWRSFSLRYDHVVWDFDGVLVDSRSEFWRAASEILALLGIKVVIRSQETFRQYFMRGGIVPDSDREILRAMHRLIMQSRAHLLEPLPCLALVARLNVPSEILTSGLAAVAQKVLGEHAKLFINIRGQESGTKDSLMHTVSRNAIFITDTIADIARCHDQALSVIAVGWGYDSIAALKNSHPDFLVESSIQLEALLGDLELLRKV
jgi:phosphoglycolate phosphatase-like HAD superfamily hydrolase